MSYLYLTVLFPLIGFILLAAGRDKLSENVAAIIGVGSVGLSALFALIAGMAFTSSSTASFCSKSLDMVQCWWFRAWH